MHSDYQQSSRKQSRREFLGAAATTLAAGVIGGPLLGSRRALAAPAATDANSRIRVGAIGVGGRASLLLQQLPESAEIVALCDCNLPRAEAFKAKAKADWPVVSGLPQDCSTARTSTP